MIYEWSIGRLGATQSRLWLLDIWDAFLRGFGIFVSWVVEYITIYWLRSSSNILRNQGFPISTPRLLQILPFLAVEDSSTRSPEHVSRKLKCYQIVHNGVCLLLYELKNRGLEECQSLIPSRVTSYLIADRYHLCERAARGLLLLTPL